MYVLIVHLARQSKMRVTLRAAPSGKEVQMLQRGHSAWHPPSGAVVAVVLRKQVPMRGNSFSVTPEGQGQHGVSVACSKGLVMGSPSCFFLFSIALPPSGTSRVLGLHRAEVIALTLEAVFLLF
ncbi:MAG: hypothetical protein ACOX34_03975 [Bacillota bacterium]